MKRFKQVVPVLAALAAIAWVNGGVAGAARTRDVCVASPTGGGGFNTFVLRDVDPLVRGAAIALRGMYFTTGSQRLAPLHGSAVMGNDGVVRVGFFVHSTAQSLNDFTAAGVTDGDFVGTMTFDSDGDFVANGTLTMQKVDCSTLVIP